jgi:hypothetical protein
MALAVNTLDEETMVWPRSLVASTKRVSGGGRRDRTDDLMLAKHALSQLSYAPVPENTKLDQLIERHLVCACAKRGGPGKT